MTDKIDTHQKPNPFDPERFRISPNSGSGNITRKLITTIPVRKPKKQAFVRCNSADANRAECGLLTIEGDDRPYIVYPEIAHLAGNELKTVQLRLAIDRQGNNFLWPVPLPPTDGPENTYNQSHRQIADLAETTWLRMSSNRTIAAYEAVEAVGDIPEPVWPELSLAEMIEIAFGKSHLIADRDHPALRKLRGEL